MLLGHFFHILLSLVHYLFRPLLNSDGPATSLLSLRLKLFAQTLAERMPDPERCGTYFASLGQFLLLALLDPDVASLSPLSGLWREGMEASKGL